MGRAMLGLVLSGLLGQSPLLPGAVSVAKWRAR